MLTSHVDFSFWFNCGYWLENSSMNIVWYMIMALARWSKQHRMVTLLPMSNLYLNSCMSPAPEEARTVSQNVPSGLTVSTGTADAILSSNLPLLFICLCMDTKIHVDLHYLLLGDAVVSWLLSWPQVRKDSYSETGQRISDWWITLVCYYLTTLGGIVYVYIGAGIHDQIDLSGFYDSKTTIPGYPAKRALSAMAGRALLAGYHRIENSQSHFTQIG